MSTPTGPFDLAQVKEQLNIPELTTSSDAEISRYILAVVNTIEFRCGPLVPRAVTDNLPGGRRLLLSTVPVVSVESVVGQPTYSPLFDVTQLTVDLDLGAITNPTGVCFPDQTVVTYTVGRLQVPDALVTAAAILVEDLWKTQNGSGNDPHGDNSDVAAMDYGYPLPALAAQLMEPFLLPPRVA